MSICRIPLGNQTETHRIVLATTHWLIYKLSPGFYGSHKLLILTSNTIILFSPVILGYSTSCGTGWSFTTMTLNGTWNYLRSSNLLCHPWRPRACRSGWHPSTEPCRRRKRRRRDPSTTSSMSSTRNQNQLSGTLPPMLLKRKTIIFWR